MSVQIGSNVLCQRSQKFLYTNGKNHPPTAIDFDKSLLKDVMFNQTTAKVCIVEQSLLALEKAIFDTFFFDIRMLNWH